MRLIQVPQLKEEQEIPPPPLSTVSPPTFPPLPVLSEQAQFKCNVQAVIMCLSHLPIKPYNSKSNLEILWLCVCV